MSAQPHSQAAATDNLAGIATGPVTAPAAAAVQARWRKLGLGFWLAVGWVALVVVLAILAPTLPFPDPYTQDLSNQGAPPGPGHPLGQDSLGRDMLSRLIYGARISLSVGALSTLLAMAVGGLMGLLAGYFRGGTDAVIGTASDALLAFPALVLALAVVTFWGHDLKNLVLVIGGLTVPAFARVTRASTLTCVHREFVLAARAMGAGNLRVIAREVLPNVAGPVLAYGLIIIAVAMLAEGTLAFLGLSLPPPAASWGAMIAEGRADLDSAAFVALMPAAAFFLTIFAFNVVADRLRRLAALRESRI